MSKYNFKITMKKNQIYAGNRRYISQEINEVIEKILSGDILIPPPLPKDVPAEKLSVNLSHDVVNKLSIIADENRISIAELLRLGLEQNNLLVQK